MAALDLRCSARAFSSRIEQGLLLTVVHRPLTGAASLLWGAGPGMQGLERAQASHWGSFSAVGRGPWDAGAGECRLSSCGTVAWLPRDKWNLLGAEIKHVPPALAGRFLFTVPPGKSLIFSNSV